MAKTTLPENEQGEAMLQHEKELREHRRSAKSSNRSTRARVDSQTREKIKQDSNSEANSMLAQNQEGEATSQCEKERRKHGRLANKLSRSERATLTESK